MSWSSNTFLRHAFGLIVVLSVILLLLNSEGVYWAFQARILESLPSQAPLEPARWRKDPAASVLQYEAECGLYDNSQSFGCSLHPKADPVYTKYVNEYIWEERVGKDKFAQLTLDTEAFAECQRNKHIVLVGDSLNRNFGASFRCNLASLALKKGLKLEQHEHVARYFKTWRLSGYNLTFSYVQSRYYTWKYSEPKDANSEQKVSVSLNHEDPAWALVADGKAHAEVPRADVLVFGNRPWFSVDPNAVRYCVDGDYKECKGEKAKYIESPKAYGLAIKFLIQYFETRKKNGTDIPILVYRTQSPRHFVGGEWNTGGKCMDQKPHDQPYIDPFSRALFDTENEILGNNPDQPFRILNITHMSSYRTDAHFQRRGTSRSTHDCLHFCLPGIPDLWMALLSRDILQCQ